MTDKEKWDAAWKELTLTTDPYPTWKKKGFPLNTHWAKAKALGEQIGQATTPPTPPPTPVPPPSGISTVTASQFAALVKPGVTLENYRVTGSIGWDVPNVTLKNVEFSNIQLNPGANGARLYNVKARAFYIWGVNDWVIQDSLFDGQNSTDDCKMWDKGGIVGRKWTIRNSIFKNFNNDADPSSHNQAIFVGSSLEGLIENCSFENNGNTAHIFVSLFGNNAITPGANVVIPSVTIRNNVFGSTHSHPVTGAAHYSVNVHPDEIPLSAKVYVEPGQTSIKPLCTPAGFIRYAP